MRSWPNRWLRVQRDGKIVFVGYIGEVEPNRPLCKYARLLPNG